MDFVRFEEDQVRPWITQAEQFVGYLKSYVERDSD